MTEKQMSALLDEIRQMLQVFESKLPRRIDAMAVSKLSKLPYKVLLYRESLMWRMAELGRSAFEDFERNRLVSATVLTRAAVETSAALWCLCAKIAAAIQADCVGNIDEHLMMLAVGIATDAPTTEDGAAFPRPIRVGHFLKEVEKDVEDFSRQYGILSEYAHPNWAGTVLLYAKHDPENRVTEFGQNIRMAENTRCIGVVNLSVALAMFERSYDRCSELIPEFAAICEKSLKATAT